MTKDEIGNLLGTKAAAALLGIRPGTLARAIWEGRVRAPSKGPGGAFLWTAEDIRHASCVLLGPDAEVPI